MQPFWLKMPKRDRGADTGVWAVSDSPDGDDAAMVMRLPAAPPAGATQPESVALRCPLPTCPLCAWGVPPAQHKDYVFIHGTYKTLMKNLEEEPELTPAIKCEQSQMLNWQLMSIERALFDNGDIKENDPLMPLTYLRSGASAAGAWGMISLAAPPPGHRANSRSAGSGAAGSAAAAGTDDGDGDDPSDGDKKKKPRKKQAKPTLERFQNWTEEEWAEWCRGAEPRLEWSADYSYEVWVDTAEGKKRYQENVIRELLAAYWRGDRCVEINVTLDDGRHSGHEHKYVVYWNGGETGMQFNKLVKDAAVRGVTITKQPSARSEEWQNWQPSSCTDQWQQWQGW